MITMMARHKVKDWNQWFGFYKAQREQLTQMGIIREAALRSSEDGNDVVVIHEFESMEDVEKFMQAFDSTESTQMLEASGVLVDTMTMELFHNN